MSANIFSIVLYLIEVNKSSRADEADEPPGKGFRRKSDLEGSVRCCDAEKIQGSSA
jgi:hypothetical protein